MYRVQDKYDIKDPSSSYKDYHNIKRDSLNKLVEAPIYHRKIMTSTLACMLSQDT